MTGSTRDLPTRAFATQRAWASWLAKNHERSDGLWVKIAKKGSGIASVTDAEALETALRYGWINGQRLRFDADFFLQHYTRRRPKSPWSKINRAKATELVERGEMEPAGLREIERAKADGRWDAAYEGQRNATVPDDLRRALARNRRARDFFATLDSRNRYAILYRMESAKRPETRARRLEQFVAMLERHETIH